MSSLRLRFRFRVPRAGLSYAISFSNNASQTMDRREETGRGVQKGIAKSLDSNNSRERERLGCKRSSEPRLESLVQQHEPVSDTGAIAHRVCAIENEKTNSYLHRRALPLQPAPWVKLSARISHDGSITVPMRRRRQSAVCRLCRDLTWRAARRARDKPIVRPNFHFILYLSPSALSKLRVSSTVYC